MINTKELLNKIKMGNANWFDYSQFLSLQESELEPFIEYAQELKKKIFNNKLKIYIPDKNFPAISLTGNECSLSCEHCEKKYLAGMKAIVSKENLKEFLLDLSKKGGRGALLSGGCEPDGSFPLKEFLDVVKEVKSRTNLIINAHSGWLNEETAIKLNEAGVDVISLDVNVDDEILRDIYHLNKNINDYTKQINLMKKYKLNIVPHICIGLYYGLLHKELESIKFIKETIGNPSLIVLIALIPPKNSNKFRTPKGIDIAKIIATIRFLFPTTEISLGCMRPRETVKVEIEKWAIKAGITRIEIPSKETLKWAKLTNPQIEFKFYSACCAMPIKFEKFIESKTSEMKGYLNI